jgi:glucose/arabinose dehydrogenase
MHGDRPTTPVDWQNAAAQWSDFVTGFQSGCSDRIGRPTGLVVGSQGSLFIGDDAAGAIYRVRPKRG